MRYTRLMFQGLVNAVYALYGEPCPTYDQTVEQIKRRLDELANSKREVSTVEVKTVRQLIQELLSHDLDAEVRLEVGGDGAIHSGYDIEVCDDNDFDRNDVVIRSA